MSSTLKTGFTSNITKTATPSVFNNTTQQYQFINAWGNDGTGDGELHHSEGISIDPSDNAYVADTGNFRIQKFDSDGNFITKWGSEWESEGTGDGEFNDSTDIAVDSGGNVYVVDSNIFVGSVYHQIKVIAPAK